MVVSIQVVFARPVGLAEIGLHPEPPGPGPATLSLFCSLQFYKLEHLIETVETCELCVTSFVPCYSALQLFAQVEIGLNDLQKSNNIKKLSIYNNPCLSVCLSVTLLPLPTFSPSPHHFPPPHVMFFTNPMVMSLFY